uniref:Flagellar protein n=1 Tax=Rheinheimera sp. BAL341 TaxID=1708203 RepID=A0A486XXA3_9GAMM
MIVIALLPVFVAAQSADSTVNAVEMLAPQTALADVSGQPALPTEASAVATSTALADMQQGLSDATQEQTDDAVAKRSSALNTATVSPRPTAGLGLGKMALSLAIVVAIVLVLGWLFKKLTLRLPGSRHIKIISTMPLGPKERLLVIEIQGKQRVLGVTSQSINLLFELENSLPEEKLASDFHTQLQSLLKK